MAGEAVAEQLHPFAVRTAVPSSLAISPGSNQVKLGERALITFLLHASFDPTFYAEYIYTKYGKEKSIHSYSSID